MISFMRRFVDFQMHLCNAFDRMLPEEYRVDGDNYFTSVVIPRYLKPKYRIYDLGGGKTPCLNLTQKKAAEIYIIGLDINQTELDRAEKGIYDETICADITSYQGNSDADLIICRALLEHVRNVDAAFKAIVSILKPGGCALIFVPSKNAIYARLNILLPEGIKRKILFTLFPMAENHQGFRSYYHKCTPKDFKKIVNQYGLEMIDRKCFFISSYFSFCFPIYLLWRLWIYIFRLIVGSQAAESFMVVLKKRFHE
ncbi:MAG: methyltransferase domain-containing protein [Candidatus Omnitrophica bacterium]|nr:methyltransferase domain-containing protein [Candidatus Omnitrophota bacterium]MDD5670027.1 methyltransferase domain-containing protein [Candidatus Omnitrophota bacterium]